MKIYEIFNCVFGRVAEKLLKTRRGSEYWALKYLASEYATFTYFGIQMVKVMGLVGTFKQWTK